MKTVEIRKTHGLLGLGILLAVFLAMMALMRLAASEVGKLSDGQGVIDLTFGITPNGIVSALTRYNKQSAEFYRWVFMPVDMIYALAYCSFYRSAIKSVLERLGARGRVNTLLPLLPVVGMAADLLENTVMFCILSGCRVWAVFAMFTVFNIIKFVFVYSSLAIVLGGALCLIKKRLS